MFWINSKRPEFLSALIAKNRPTSVGNIFITVSMPSLAPYQKTIKHFYLFCKSVSDYVKNGKWNSYYRYVMNYTQRLFPPFLI